MRPAQIDDHAQALCEAAVTLAEGSDARAIVAVTRGGGTVRRLAALRPKPSVIATTNREDTARRAALLWGVTPVVTDIGESVDTAPLIGRQLVTLGLVPGGATVVFVSISQDLGRTDANFYANTLMAAVLSAAFVAGLVVGGWRGSPALGVAAGYSLTMLLVIGPLYMLYCLRVAGIRPRNWLRQLRRPALAALAMGVVVWVCRAVLLSMGLAPLAVLAIEVSLGVAEGFTVGVAVGITGVAVGVPGVEVGGLAASPAFARISCSVSSGISCEMMVFNWRRYSEAINPSSTVPP